MGNACRSSCKAKRTFALKTPLPHVIAVAALGLGGCSLAQSDPDGRAQFSGSEDLVRHIRLEVDDPGRSLPCRVIDHPGAGAPKVLWRAEFEQGFCERKAEETLFLLRERGWACRALDPDDRPTPEVVAIWRCLEGLEPVERQTALLPRVPAPRPTLQEASPPQETPSVQAAPRPEEVAPPPADGDLLDQAVERDLAAIGQDIVGDSSALATALGDLNDDGIEDAVVLLTRGADREVPQRMLMAYLRNDQDYTLVDVWILRPPGERQDDRLTLAIEDGKVQLGDCCDDRDGPTALVLDGRKLVHAEDG